MIEKVLALFIVGPLIFLGAVIVMTAMDLIMAYPLMLAWNYVIPAVFHLQQIGYWQAFCLLLVASFLIKGQSTASSKS